MHLIEGGILSGCFINLYMFTIDIIVILAFCSIMRHYAVTLAYLLHIAMFTATFAILRHHAVTLTYLLHIAMFTAGCRKHSHSLMIWLSLRHSVTIRLELYLRRDVTLATAFLFPLSFSHYGAQNS